MNNSVMERFPTEIQDFANQFAELQERRHEVGYDPFSKFTRGGVHTAIGASDIAIKKLRAADNKYKAAFAAWTVMRN